jgi:FixJ family two-component response regulator
MKRGAVDFLSKPVNDSDPLAAVRNAIEIDRVHVRGTSRWELLAAIESAIKAAP